MIEERGYYEDEKTILLNHQGQIPIQGPLTDSTEPPRFEQLEERMIRAARLRPDEAFSVSLSPLMAAASELPSEVVRLKHNIMLESLATLRERLVPAMEPFELRAVQGDMGSNQVMAAYYVLYTVVGKAVMTTPWDNENEWSKISLLNGFYNKILGGGEFFQLPGRLSKNPVEHLPILKLMYLCPILGPEGKYQVMARGVLDPDDTSGTLCRQIHRSRDDVPHRLSPHWQGFNDRCRGPVQTVP